MIYIRPFLRTTMQPSHNRFTEVRTFIPRASAGIDPTAGGWTIACVVAGKLGRAIDVVRRAVRDNSPRIEGNERRIVVILWMWRSITLSNAVALIIVILRR